MTKKLTRLIAIATVFTAVSLYGFDIREHYYAVSDKYLDIWGEKIQRTIDDNIEKNRKADAVFSLELPPGTPVKVTQISHCFLFGAQLFNYNQLGSAEANRIYQDLFGTLFNQATIPMYWRDLEPQENAMRTAPEAADSPEFWYDMPDREKHPAWRRPRPDTVIDFCKRKKIWTHGHLMAWANADPSRHLPAWLMNKVPQEILNDPVVKEKQKSSKTGAKLISPASIRAIFGNLTAAEFAAKHPEFVAEFNRCWYKYITDLAANYGKNIDSWDVVNEATIDFADCDNFSGQSEYLVPGSEICRSFYGIAPGDYVYKSFQCAEKSLPSRALLFINDYAALDPSMEKNYVDLVKNLVARKTKIDGIGNQVHIFRKSMMLDIVNGNGSFATPDMLMGIYRRQSETGVPLRISEITIPNPTNDTKGESMQAVVAYNLYRLWFSIGEIKSICWWNVVDGVSAGKEKMQSGILRKDMSRKPVFYALDHLINHEWRTDLTVSADKDGKVSFRGFRGSYLLSWQDKDGRNVSKLAEVK